MPMTVPAFRHVLLRGATCALAGVAVLGAAPIMPSAYAAKAPVLKPKDDALHILHEGLKSPDFVARGMAYEGIAFDKKNKELKQILKNNKKNPQ